MNASIQTPINRGEDGVTAKARGAVRQRVESAFKQSLVTAAPVLFGLVLFVTPVAAQSESELCPANQPEAFCDIIRLLTKIQTLIIIGGLVFATVMIGYAGLLAMRGRPEDWKRARDVIIRTGIGVVIILSASGIVEFIREVIVDGGG